MKIFISRTLSPESVLLKHPQWEISQGALLRLEALAFTLPANSDWIFFSSQNGVRFFFEGIRTQSMPRMRWACIGPATAKALLQAGVAPDFTGNGDPLQTAAAFRMAAEGQHVLFAGARHAREALRQAVAEYAHVSILHVYDNQPIENIPASDARVLIFTSPMNAEAYFAHNILKNGQTLVAIGSSTADALFQIGFKEVLISEKPDEHALADLILSHLYPDT